MSNVQLGYTQVIDPISFKSIPSGKIYIGEYGTLPNPANAGTWKQAYFVNSDGTRTAASQPIRTNAAGYAVDGSGNVKHVEVSGLYSVLIQDQFSATKFSLAFGGAPSDTKMLTVDAITEVDATSLPDGVAIFAKGRTVAGDGGGGIFRYASGSAHAADGGLVFAPLAGSGRLFRDGWTVFGFAYPVNVIWFGAKAGDNTLAVAQSNTLAFRAACLSMKSVWEAWKTGLSGRSVYVPAGDFNLSNGFTLPKGCSIYGDGLGASRLKILAATADASNKLPLVSLGRVINDGTLATETTTGPYVTDPAPQIDRLYLNPQNSNTALDITGIPGFCVGDLWIQADVGLNLGDGTGDGIIGKLFVEDSTSIGVRLLACQNITIQSIYSYVTNTPVEVFGNCNNIDIGTLQANYTKVAVLQTNDSVAAGRIRINNLVCNQNEQYGTFTSVIRTRSASCDISIGNMDARNYNGYAINNETGIGNNVSVDRLSLRQTPNNATYTLGTTAKGVRSNNSNVTVGYADIAGLSDSPFEFAGTVQSARLEVNGGVIGTFAGSNRLTNITGTVGSVTLRNLRNSSGVGLFNAQASINPTWENIISPFPSVSEGGRLAIKIPFVGYGNAWNLTIRANVAPGGNANYRRTKKLWVSQETGFNGSILVTNIGAVSLGDTSLTTGFTPNITYQLDLGTVGSGAQLAAVAFGEAVVSIPSTYASTSFAISRDV